MELRQSQAAGTEESRSVAAHFGVGPIAVKSGGVVYVARCGMVVVELRNHTACTQEIPVVHQGKEVYVDPLSLVIQRSATPVKCKKKAPPRWKIGKEWFCGYPEIRPCNGPGPLPGHRRTNVQGRNTIANPDPEEEMGDHQQRDGEHNKPAHEVLEELAADISRRWLGGYVGLETLPGIVGTAMLGISATEMILSTAVRMSVLYAWKGPGPWMAAAIWGTAFQVVIMPGRWAMEWGAKSGGSDSPGHGSQDWSWRSKPSHRRGRDRPRRQKLVKIKQREEHGTARLLLQCSGGVCCEGYFLLPFNE